MGFSSIYNDEILFLRTLNPKGEDSLIAIMI